ncbi:type II CAAX endopeptidase family protein [Clostridium aestuarii]|uniref:Type II CAAX endopeptidase family protein n=1 Tax=Clostridium aestuarii TaxID=338193 RepID=A0ABT4D6E6_9CLOT|nr:type II CAAX endopeptidase family protein [Clostridium aestuarii]MCY6485755.1 type II CAAX endopeptidase family protein [Clostridium aestuarii]
MEISTEQKGISIGESIELLFMINIAQFLLMIPLGLVAAAFEDASLNTIAQYIKILNEIVVYIYIIRKVIKRINLREDFKLKIQYKPKFKEGIYVVLAVLGYTFVYSNTLELLLSNIQVSQWIEEAFDELVKTPIILTIYVSVIAPIFEETICRGIILEQLYKRYGMIRAVIVSSLLFAIMHLNIHQGVNAFFIGLLLGFVYIKTNSLLLSMFLHFVNNSLVSLRVFIPFLNIGEEKFSIIQLICGAILLIVSYKFFNNIEVDSSRKFNFKSGIHI